MIGAPMVYAKSAYQSGFRHGISDAKKACSCDWYILQPGKGFKFHSNEFFGGYIVGFCSVADPKALSHAAQTKLIPEEFECGNHVSDK